MTKSKKEITNKDLFGLISKLDTKISSVEKNLGKKIDSNAKHIKANYSFIEELAIMTQKGFEGVDKKFEAVDNRFDKIEKLLIVHDKNFEDIMLRMNEVAYSLEVRELDRKVSSLEFKVKRLEAQRQ